MIDFMIDFMIVCTLLYLEPKSMQTMYTCVTNKCWWPSATIESYVTTCGHSSLTPDFVHTYIAHALYAKLIDGSGH